MTTDTNTRGQCSSIQPATLTKQSCIKKPTKSTSYMCTFVSMFDIERLLKMKNTLSCRFSGGTFTHSIPSLFASSVSILVALATDGCTDTFKRKITSHSPHQLYTLVLQLTLLVHFQCRPHNRKQNRNIKYKIKRHEKNMKKKHYGIEWQLGTPNRTNRQKYCRTTLRQFVVWFREQL